MEFIELARCQLRQNSIRSFSLVSSGLLVGVLGSTSEAYILELKYSPLGTHTFPYRIETVKLPMTLPLSGVMNQFDVAQLYTKLNTLKRQYITLDPLFVSELSTEPSKVLPVTILWAPSQIFKESTMAIITNTGICELRQKDVISREWKVLVCSLNQFYKDLFPVNLGIANTFEELKRDVENHCTTSFSWNLDSSKSDYSFVMTNATGWILLFSVDDSGKICFRSRYETSLGRISRIYLIRNLIITCSSNGLIETFSLNGTGFNKLDILWNRADRLPCKMIHITYDREFGKWVLVTSKSSHVLAFILHENGKSFLKKTVYLGNMEITGFEMLSPQKYIFVTINGTIELISLKITNMELKIDVQKVRHEFDSKNYQIVGLASSPNKVAWTFLLFHNKPYTHPSAYSSKDAFVSFCSLNINDAFLLLQKSTVTRSNLLDCAEVVRLDIIKNNVTSKYESVSLDNVGINAAFLKKLQLKLLILKAEQIYQRHKFNHVRKSLSSEISSIQKMIECVYISLRLRFLYDVKNPTHFQLISGKCMKYKLKQLHTELICEEDVYRNVQENIITLSDCLLMDLGSTFENASEKCSYCHEDIDFNTLMCPNLHFLPRCSISYQQVPLFTKLFCSNCLRPLIADVELLRSLFADSEEIKCTFCGFALNDLRETFNVIN